MSTWKTISVVVTLVCCLTAPISGYVKSRGLASDNTIVQIKWGSGPISWQLNSTIGSNIGGAHPVADVVRQSFQSWSSIPTAIITFNEGPPTTSRFGYDGKNVIVTNLTVDDWTALGLDQNVIAFTLPSWSTAAGVQDKLGRTSDFAGQMMDADIVFSPLLAFSTDDSVPTDKIDFQSVLTHEIGHLLGLDHSPMISATMFWGTPPGVSSQRTLSADDIAGVSSIYPAASFLSKGTIRGVVRTTASAPVFGAVVVAIDANGLAVSSAITDPNGQYSIEGLDGGSYSVYAQPLEVFISSANIYTLSDIYPNKTVSAGFTARFR